MNYSNTEEAFVLSSLKEFVKAWGSGRQGCFSLECRNGLACVKLSFDLGHPSEPHCHETHGATPSFFQTKPSRNYVSARQRKNNERAKAHREKLAAASAAHSSAQSSSLSSATTTVHADVPHEAQLNLALSSDLLPIDAPEVSEAAKVTCDESEIAATASEISNQDEPAATAKAKSNSNQDSVPVSSPSCIIPVYGIAAFENCPDECLTDDYLNSLKQFNGSEEHLCRNITSIEFSPPSSRCFRNGYFTHTMALVLHVKTDRLWESPAKYVRKHLGCPNNEWSKQNGTVVKLSRIHQ